MVSLSSATLVAITAILNSSSVVDGFVTPTSPSIKKAISSSSGGNTALPRSCDTIIISSFKKSQLTCLLTSPPSTTTTLYSTNQEITSTTEEQNNGGKEEEALEAVFATYSDDKTNLMSKDQFNNVPAISDMLAKGDLSMSEIDDMWNDILNADMWDAMGVSRNKSGGEQDNIDNRMIDLKGFVQVYNGIDDLFEDDDEEEETVDEDTLAAVSAALAAATSGGDESELTQVFETLKKGNDDGDTHTISFAQLRQWEEITSLVNEGMLGEDEFKSLWESSGSSGDGMDLERFLKFNSELDDLFVFDDDDEEEVVNDEVDEISSDMAIDEEEETEQVAQQQQQQLPMITETDLPPAVLFSQLANENYLVGQTELERWGEVQEMISEGDLSQEELDVLVGRVEKAPGTDGMYLDEEGFCTLAEAIDDLFEEVGDDATDDDEQEEEEEDDFRELKVELLELLEDIDKIGEEEGRLLCGLDCNELEQERVLEVVGELEREPYNEVVAVSSIGGGAVSKEELVGDWELLYSSSSTMKYNEGLSGLAGGLTRFGGLKQKIIGTKYLSDVEYTEQVIGKLGGKSYEVKITGDWDMKTELSLFTGKPANVMSVTPDNVVYGPRRDKADHWKSLGPMNMLLLSYIDEDLRIMRGNTSTDTLFIWKRC